MIAGILRMRGAQQLATAIAKHKLLPRMGIAFVAVATSRMLLRGDAESTSAESMVARTSGDAISQQAIPGTARLIGTAAREIKITTSAGVLPPLMADRASCTVIDSITDETYRRSRRS